MKNRIKFISIKTKVEKPDDETKKVQDNERLAKILDKKKNLKEIENSRQDRKETM